MLNFENKELVNNGINSKEKLIKWDVNQALDLLLKESKETISFSQDLNRIWLEIYAYQLWEEWDKFTSWVDDILSNFLLKKQ